jgi:SAM-dependent methyltransferase
VLDAPIYRRDRIRDDDAVAPDTPSEDSALDPAWLELSYDAFPRVEEAFHAALDISLDPRGPDVLYDLVADMGLPPGADAIDVGCGEAGHSFELAERFGFDVTGIDPVARHLEVANADLQKRAASNPRFAARVRFVSGAAEDVPIESGSVDLVWCRDVLVHVSDLPSAYREFRRVLRDDGRALVYQVFAGDRLDAHEAEWFWRTMGVVPTSADPARTEAAYHAAGLRLDAAFDLEWGEWAEEQSGKAGRRLLWAARLLRQPERYIDQFGQGAYEIMLGDCLWHVYGMIGKLQRRVLLLSAG